MKKIKLGSSNMEVSPVAVGCMRMNSVEQDKAAQLIEYAVERGIHFFDHADIYGRGSCEEKFAKALKATKVRREDIMIQTKCGIIPGKMYDLSKEHIVFSAEQSLKKLDTDYIDVFLLHRPDALVEPEEVAEAFDLLKRQGKVRFFGVSNHNTMQLKLLKKYLNEPLMVNQLQFGLGHTAMVSAGMEANMMTEGAVNRDGSVLDYCRLEDITIQAWAPFQSSKYKEVFLDNEKYLKLNERLGEIAKRYNVTPMTIATAWILRHPANIQMLAGTMKVSRLKEIADAMEIKLTREEWYDLYISAGNILP